MSVYVDALVGGWGGSYRGPLATMASRVGARNNHQWCHLVADSEAELHAFASLIGLRREWYQNHHYDLTPGRRKLACALGAIEVDRKQFVRILRKLKGNRT